MRERAEQRRRVGERRPERAAGGGERPPTTGPGRGSARRAALREGGSPCRTSSGRATCRRARRRPSAAQPAGADLAGDADAGAAEEVERRLAADHGEDRVVRERLRPRPRRRGRRPPSRGSPSPGCRAGGGPSPARCSPVEGPGGGRDALGGGLLDRDVGHRVAPQGLELLDVLGLRAAELGLAVGERDAGAARRRGRSRSRARSRPRRRRGRPARSSPWGRGGGSRPCRAPLPGRPSLRKLPERPIRASAEAPAIITSRSMSIPTTTSISTR